MTEMLVMMAVAVGGFAPVAAFGWWMVHLGTTGGDRETDATSRLGVTDDGAACLAVTNRSDTPVLVGALTRDERPFAIGALTPALVRRPARRHERRSTTLWRDAFLGVVAPQSEKEWPVPAVLRRTRLVVAIGQSDGQLRIHDHLVTPEPSPVINRTGGIATR